MQIRAARLSKTGRASGAESRLETRKLFRHCWSTYSTSRSKVTNARICPGLAIKFDSPREHLIRRSVRRKESLRSATGKPASFHLHAQARPSFDINWKSNFMQRDNIKKDCPCYWSVHFGSVCNLSRIKECFDFRRK